MSLQYVDLKNAVNIIMSHFILYLILLRYFIYYLILSSSKLHELVYKNSSICPKNINILTKIQWIFSSNVLQISISVLLRSNHDSICIFTATNERSYAKMFQIIIKICYFEGSRRVFTKYWRKTTLAARRPRGYNLFVLTL